MLYVLKHVKADAGFPEVTKEYPYAEPEIVVTKGIGVCELDATKEYMFTLGYDVIGQIEKREDLDVFLESLSKSEEKIVVPISNPSLQVDIKDVIDLKEGMVVSDKPPVPLWWQNP